GGKAAAILPRLVSAGFSAATIKDLSEKYPQISDAIKKGDYKTAESLAGKSVLEAGMAFLAGKHAVVGGAEPPVESDVSAPKAPVRILKQLPAASEPPIGARTAHPSTG